MAIFKDSKLSEEDMKDVTGGYICCLGGLGSDR